MDQGRFYRDNSVGVSDRMIVDSDGWDRIGQKVRVCEVKPANGGPTVLRCPSRKRRSSAQTKEI